MQQRPPVYGGYPANNGVVSNGIGHDSQPQPSGMKPPMPAVPTTQAGMPPRPMSMATGYNDGRHMQPTAYGQPPVRPVPTSHGRPPYPGTVSPPGPTLPPMPAAAGILHPQQTHYSSAQTGQQPMMRTGPAIPPGSPPTIMAPMPLPPQPGQYATHVQSQSQSMPMPPPLSSSMQSGLGVSHQAGQSFVPPTVPSATQYPSVHGRLPAPTMLPPTGIEKLTSQMQNLNTMSAIPTVAAAPTTASTVASQNQPVGIIGQPLPIEEVQKVPVSPIRPTLDPAYTRLTLNKIPRTAALLYKTKLPFGITVIPYATLSEGFEVPLIDGPIVRCRRCRTYLNPYVQLLDQGMKWKCNLCFLDNDFPPNYDYDPVTQKYVERTQKAELNCPVYEFVAPMEYMVRPPQPPVYLFLLDVSYNAVTTGLVSTASRLIASALDAIPNAQGRTRVGIMTVDSAIHFYQIPTSGEGEPKMLVVSDLEEPFLPAPESLLVDLAEGRTNVERALQKVSTLFASTQISSSALGPALGAAAKLLGPIGGKIVVLQATLPTLGEGRLQARDDARLYGSSKESSLLQPATSYYKTLATECQRLQVCVDLFCFPRPFLDMATLGCVARFTGGHIYLYESWEGNSLEAVERLAGDLTDLLSMEMGLEAVIRIRASQGLSLGNYHGSFFLRSSDLLSLPNVNHRHAYTAQVTIEENITSQLACFQTAVLHTTCHGERRIRVLNAAYPVTDDARELFAHADVGALGDLLLKMAVEKVWSHRLEDARDALINKMTDILGAVKTIYQTGQNPQLLLPESLRLLPLLLLAILKSPPIRAGSDMTADARTYYLTLVKTLSVSESLSLIHPFMFAFHSLPDVCGLPDEQGRTVMPPAMHLGSEMLERHGFYVLDNGQELLIWLGVQVHPELLQLVFGPGGVPAAGLISLPVLENAWSRRLAAILAVLRQRHPGGGNASVWLVGEELGAPQVRTRFLRHLIEDKGPDTQPSYAIWAAMLRDKIYANSR